MAPFVSVLLLSKPGRDGFLRLARAAVARQTYAPLEVVEECGHGPIGAARNRACAIARGDILVHFDDDEWQAPDRIERQVQALLYNSHARVAGTSEYYAVDLLTGASVEKAEANGVACGSLCFWRSAWEEYPFDSRRNQGEANAFTEHHRRATVDTADRSLFVYTRHPRQTTAGGRLYGANAADATIKVLQMLGPDLERYAEAAREAQ